VLALLVDFGRDDLAAMADKVHVRLLATFEAAYDFVDDTIGQKDLKRFVHAVA
jgi:glutaredoxin-related protein